MVLVIAVELSKRIAYVPEHVSFALSTNAVNEILLENSIVPFWSRVLTYADILDAVSSPVFINHISILADVFVVKLLNWYNSTFADDGIYSFGGVSFGVRSINGSFPANRTKHANPITAKIVYLSYLLFLSLSMLPSN